MPELPEVHTISTDLNKHISGYKIESARILGSYRVLPDKNTFINGIREQPIIGVERVAKNIIINLGSGNALVIHLAMTGQVLIKEQQSKPVNWVRVILRLSKEADAKTLVLSDMRMFGKAELLEKNGLTTLKNRYGPEPIKESLSVEEFHKQLNSKKTAVKNVLLDQSIISGMGNIYATDALFIAGIHPETPSHKITSQMAGSLLEAAREILKEGIEHRGSTLPDKMYVDIFGNEGTHQNYFRIYGKKNCPNCETEVVFKKVGGRGTFFCPSCQSPDGQKTLL
jgi:formamidopyrimidine-DNA glycosylase